MGGTRAGPFTLASILVRVAWEALLVMAQRRRPGRLARSAQALRRDEGFTAGQRRGRAVVEEGA